MAVASCEPVRACSLVAQPCGEDNAASQGSSVMVRNEQVQEHDTRQVYAGTIHTSWVHVSYSCTQNDRILES